MKSVNRIFFWFSVSLTGLTFPLETAFGQPSIFIQAEDVTIQKGRRAFITQWPDASTANVYVGLCCDRITKAQGQLITGGERGVQFTTQALFETTRLFIEVCNDFGCTFSRNITITVLPFENASILSGPWWFSDWLGAFNVSFAADGWLFHIEHDWLFLPADSSIESFFFYDLSSQRWYWTSNSTYPNMFSFSRNAWVFYFKDTTGPREFVDLVSGEFFNVD